VVATIRQEFPLAAFPFDVQSLDVHVDLEADPSVAQLLPMRANLSDGSPDVADVAYDEIRLPGFHFLADLPHAQGIRTLRTLPPKSGPTRLSGSIATSQAFVSIPIARASSNHLCTSGAALFIISLCICSTFVVPASSTGTRMALDLVLLLTVVAFKLYMAHSLPQTSDLTRLDRFAVAIFVLLLVVLCLQAVVFLAQRMRVEIAVWLDLFGWAACLLGWIIYTLGLLISCRFLVGDQIDRMRRHLKSLTDQHQRSVDILEGLHRPGARRNSNAQENSVRRGSRTPKPGTALRNGRPASARKTMV